MSRSALSGRGGFDRIVVVDWSANSTPKRGRDSIWIAVHDGGTPVTRNCPTRSDAVAFLAEVVDVPGRLLVGVDFSLGYPSGTARSWGLDDRSWRGIWSELAGRVVDAERNANNRFEVASELNGRSGMDPGPFWGCPPNRRSPTLTSTKVAFDASATPSEWRLVEQRLRSDGHRPFSSWQLLGAGAVGSQSLLGIAAMEHFVEVRDDVDVWPFTCGASQPGQRIVVCEVWPSLIPLPPLGGRVRDEAQVVALSEHLVGAQRDGSLTSMFAPDLSDGERAIVEGEEGWVLGA